MASVLTAPFDSFAPHPQRSSCLDASPDHPSTRFVGEVITRCIRYVCVTPVENAPTLI